MFSARSVIAAAASCVIIQTGAFAQVTTADIVGRVTDSTGSVLPGVTVTVENVGTHETRVAPTGASGDYTFNVLPIGRYTVKIELQGFKNVTHDDIRVSASFVATVNAKLEVGSVSESITVTGQSPTVDTKSNVQQTVMNQEILEGVPSGRDPWSVAKLIPGVQVATYDVGGTQSIQQSSLPSML